MELHLMGRETPVWLSGVPQRKTARVSAESVIPDTREDLARVLWAQGGVLLKGKELGAGSVTVNGEAWASVLYLTEGEGRLNWLRLQKPFALDFDTDGNDEAALPQVRLWLTGLEARALNPRKLAADFEVSGELRSFARGSIALESQVQEPPAGLHLRQETREALAVTAVCEKPFTVREQFALTPGQPAPAEIAGESLRFCHLSAEQLGGRCVVKGELALEIWGLTEEGEPARLRFTAPFSQLLEPGEGTLDEMALTAQASSVYLEWVDGFGGEKALDAELHGVLQLTGWSRLSVQTVQDAYSTRMACAPRLETRRLLTERSSGRAPVTAEERLPLPEDCAELLDVQPLPGAAEGDREAVSWSVGLALLYRRADGGLSAARRSLRLAGPPLEEGCVCSAGELERLDARPEGESLAVRAEGTVLWERQRETAVESVAVLELTETPREEGPTVFLVRRGGESLWELAKAYGSSEEAIRALNPDDAPILLVTREHG